MIDVRDRVMTLHTLAYNSTSDGNNVALTRFFCEIAEIAERYNCDIDVFADELDMSMVFKCTDYVTNDSISDMHDEIISLMRRSTGLFDKYVTVSGLD